jgi:serine acetyltransferase
MISIDIDEYGKKKIAIRIEVTLYYYCFHSLMLLVVVVEVWPVLLVLYDNVVHNWWVQLFSNIVDKFAILSKRCVINHEE